MFEVLFTGALLFALAGVVYNEVTWRRELRHTQRAIETAIRRYDEAGDR